MKKSWTTIQEFSVTKKFRNKEKQTQFQKI